LNCRTPLLDLGQSWGPSFYDMNLVNYYMLPSRLTYHTLHSLIKPRQLSTLTLYRTMSSSNTSQPINKDIVSRVSLTSRRVLFRARIDGSLLSCVVQVVRANPPYLANYSKTTLDSLGSQSRIPPGLHELERRMEGNTTL
jgi:hypothetical protein